MKNPTFTTDEDRWQAVLARDPLADDQFVFAVQTTGIFCRPSCRARHALRKNVRFYPDARHAAQAGFRPCKRCMPDKRDPQAQKLRRQKIQIVFQNPYGSLNPRKKVGQILEEPLLINSNLSKEQRREKALAMMAKVGLKTEHYDRYPHMFSGGQRQRIAIARGLMLDPDVVIADEPVSALDVSVRAQVLNLMMDLQQELGLSYVFISHDLSVVEHIADEVMVMYLGRCVEKGTKDQIFNNPRHPYTQALLSATPRLNPDDRRERIKLTGELPSPLNPPPGCAFNARCSRRFGPCTQLQPQLKDYRGQLVACFAVDQDENGEKPQA